MEKKLIITIFLGGMLMLSLGAISANHVFFADDRFGDSIKIIKLDDRRFFDDRFAKVIVLDRNRFIDDNRFVRFFGLDRDRFFDNDFRVIRLDNKFFDDNRFIRLNNPRFVRIGDDRFFRFDDRFDDNIRIIRLDRNGFFNDDFDDLFDDSMNRRGRGIN